MAELETEQLELICRARAGDAEKLSTLAELVRQRVYAYINRVTLNPETAQDLTQDTLMSVLGSLDKLEQVERFWPWIFRIATNKVRQHFRETARHRTVQMVDEQAVSAPRAGRPPGVGSDAEQGELAELTRAAMAGMSDRHREVLTLRFYENLSHSEIARVMECSELATRAALFRAKSALAGELKRRGLTRSMLAAALAAFGQATLLPNSSAAAVSISAGALAESTLATLLSAKVKAASAIAACLLIVCGVAWWSPSSSMANLSKPVKWVHFSRHSGQPVSDPIRNVIENQSQGIYEQWYHFPEGLDGPMFFRMQRWSPDGKQKLCWWVENGDANYYVHSGEQKIYIHNDHITPSSAVTKCLPIDPVSMAEFIRGVEGEKSGAMVGRNELVYDRDPRTGFVATHDDTRFPGVGRHHAIYDYKDLDLKLFDAPTGMEVVDERDAMHKRGWTYFQVEGRLEGRKIEGFGCLPFAYRASKQHPAWVRLSVDGRPAMVDDGQVACQMDADGKVEEAFPGGALFKGMARPWMGYHTADIIRRDAAGERIWFSAERIEPENTIAVTLVDDRGEIQHMLKYTVSETRDVLERIEIWRGPQGVFSERVGDLVFRYDDRMTQPVGDVSRPSVTAVAESVRREPATVLWPLRLLRPTASQVALLK